MGWQGPITNRQFKVWEAWFILQKNEPSRGDYYIMQLCAIVASIMSEKKHELDDFKISFSQRKAKDAPFNNRRHNIVYSKCVWTARLGMNPPEELIKDSIS